MKKNSLKICASLVASVIALYGAEAAVSRTTKTTKTTEKKQSVIQSGTKVRTKAEAKNLYDQECYDTYYSCMDQFCITDNANGGSCACSDANAEFEKQLDDIQKQLEEAERMTTEEVERIEAGANADIIFGKGRTYDKDGNVVTGQNTKSSKDKMLEIFNTSSSDDEDEDEDVDIEDQVGDALRDMAHDLCLEQMPESCDKDMTLLTSMYKKQIVSDCKAFENMLATKKSEAKKQIASAESAVRSALKDSLKASNKFDRGTCMVEFKKCMQTSDACGTDWENCVSIIASENMQNNKAKSTANTKVATVDKYDITDSTMEILDSKRNICEKVLDQCMAVRDYVWTDFLREAAPTIKLAESKAESKKRQSCLSTISDCIQTACKDDIVGKGQATMDACLARPDMARSFCKVEIDPCERMEPQIWDYVTDKLAAMRVDACTQEVKDCFTDETRCGPDFSNCIGMDFDYIHDICPVDKLVVCKQTNKNFSMDNLDSMLMGLYLNVDNSALEVCENLIEEKMTEICGSTSDCNTFATDELIGQNSLRSQKTGDLYRITGMISFGEIKMGSALSGKVIGGDGKGYLEAGQLDVDAYIEKLNKMYTSDSDLAIVSNIESELRNIEAAVNRTIDLISSDEKIGYCISGRNLEQITGKKEKTGARFPNLLNQARVVIANAALKKAQENYNKKFSEEVAKASKEASLDIAAYQCYNLPTTGMSGLATSADSNTETAMSTPYSISYDIAVGMNKSDLMKGGKSSSSLAGGLKTNWNNKKSIQIDGGTKEVYSIFDRENRICSVCTTTSVENCKKLRVLSWKTVKKGCETVVNGPNCQEFHM